MLYFVIQCKHCGNWQTCQVLRITTYTFSCRQCNKTTKLKHKNRFGLALKTVGPFFTTREATDRCQRIRQPIKKEVE